MFESKKEGLGNFVGQEAERAEMDTLGRRLICGHVFSCPDFHKFGVSRQMLFWLLRCIDWAMVSISADSSGPLEPSIPAPGVASEVSRAACSLNRGTINLTDCTLQTRNMQNNRRKSVAEEL